MKRGFDGIKGDGTNDKDGHGWMRWMVEARDHGRPRPTSQTGSAGEILSSFYVEGTVCGVLAEDEAEKGVPTLFDGATIVLSSRERNWLALIYATV